MDSGKSAMDVFRDGCVIPALPLTLDSSGKWNTRRQKALIRYYLDAGAGGIAVAVHTTQFEIRDGNVNLYAPLLELAGTEIDAYIKANGREILKIAGVCGPEDQAVREASTAKAAGYHAVLLSPGGLDQLTEDALLERTRRVAEILPVIAFYLQSAVGGRRFSYRYWEEICKIPGLIGMKSAPFDRYQTLELVRAAAMSPRSGEITLYTGNDDNIVMDLLTTYRFEKDGKVYEKGFSGGLLGHWAVWTSKAVSLLEKIKEVRGSGNIPAELLTLAQQITDCNGAFFDVAHQFSGCITGIHEVLRRQGLMENIRCLSPKEKLSPGQAEEIDRVYAMYPELNDDDFVGQNLARWLEESGETL